METKIKILAFAPRYSGCAYHRVILPLMKMDGIEGSVVNHVEAVAPQKFDLFFFNRVNRFCDGDLDRARKLFDCRVVVDIDDFWRLPVDHIYYNHYKEIDEELIEKNIIQADQVITTTPRLADQVYRLNRNVIVIPNALPFGEDQFNDEREPGDKVRFFWCGGSTHEKDLEVLRNPLRRLSGYRDALKMVLGGYSTGNDTEARIWSAMSKSFTANLSLPFEIYPGVPPDQYLNLYRHADVCLVPLREHPWNAYKSNLKFLEAAAKKIPVVSSAVAPYFDTPEAPVLWVKSQSDWFQNIKNLINDKSKRDELGQKLNEWAVKNYNLRTVNQLRWRTFGGPQTT